MSREFEKIKVDRLIERFDAIVGGSPETNLAGVAGEGGAAPAGTGRGQRRHGAGRDGEAGGAERFSVDLTERARKGEIDPIAGRDEEIRQIVDILMRRRQNNPILTGEAGVGKTAVVEGFALRIAAGDVPPPLKDVTLRALDVGLLQAGASMKGEFENRLRQVIDEVQSSPKPIILFIDEAHTLVGAGGAAGTGDAANLLKPALARGKLRTIAATTWAEYKKHIEKDPALTRRFQVVQIPEPTEDKALLMMRGMASTLEDAPQRAGARRGAGGGGQAVASLHSRPPAARQGGQPAGYRVRARGHQPARGARRGGRQPQPHRGAGDRAGDHRAREARPGGTPPTATTSAQDKLVREQKRLAELEARWKEEKELVDQILEIRAQLRGPATGGAKMTPADKAAARRGTGGQGAGSGPGTAARRDHGPGGHAGGHAADLLRPSTSRRWPRWSGTGRASRWVGWSRTRSRRC